MTVSEWAREEAERHLAPLGRRWVHSKAVARQAGRLVGVLAPEDQDLLVAAAYLHDVGYAPALVETEFHPLDGARWLAWLGHDRLAGLVAHHSAARYEAELRGLARELGSFRNEDTDMTAALAYCDLTTGPNGEAMTPADRLAEVEDRHGPGSPIIEGLRRGWLELMGAVALVEERLSKLAVGQPR